VFLIGHFICVSLVFLCLECFLFVIVWLSVAVQLIVWKDSSLNGPIVCPVAR